MILATNIGWVAVLISVVILLAGFTLLIAIIYVIVKRIQDKKAEDFEKRNH